MNITETNNQTSVIEPPVLRCLKNEADFLEQLDERLECVQDVIDSIAINGLTNQSAAKLLDKTEFLYLKAYWVKAEVEAQHGASAMNLDIFEKNTQKGRDMGAVLHGNINATYTKCLLKNVSTLSSFLDMARMKGFTPQLTQLIMSRADLIAAMTTELMIKFAELGGK